MDKQPPSLKPTTWAQAPYKRSPWIKDSLHLAERIPPQKDQKSNTSIPREAVMKPREESVGRSNAFTLNTAGDEAEESTPRRSHPDTNHDL